MRSSFSRFQSQHSVQHPTSTDPGESWEGHRIHSLSRCTIFRQILLSSLILTVSLLTGSCSGGRKFSKDGYEWVPIEKVQSQTGGQNKMTSNGGKPTTVWKTPFGTYMWVYCFYGVPIRVIYFGEKEMIKEGEPSPNRKDLCAEP